MSEEKKIETYDEEKKVGILSGKAPLAYNAGPRRQAPVYYAGERYGTIRNSGVPDVRGHALMAGRPRFIQYPDVERHPNGALPSKRDKLARRVIRAALKRKFSKVETALGLPRGMKMQAREISHDQHRSTRWAWRLYERELAIHEPVYAPDQKQLRAMRTEKRRLRRQGKPADAISKLVDRMAGERK